MIKNSLRPLFFPESNRDTLENSTDNTLLHKLGLERLITRLQELKNNNGLTSQSIQAAIEETVDNSSFDQFALFTE